MQRLTMGLLMLLLVFTLVACGGTDNSLNEPITTPNPPDEISNGDAGDTNGKPDGDNGLNEADDEAEEPSPSVSMSIEERSEQTIHAIRDQDMELLAEIAHPDYGVIFTPYGHIHPLEDVSFMPAQIAELMDDETVYTWGHYDGRGDPIELTFAEYYDQFIYDEDFANPHQMSYNERIGQGNSVDNIAQVFSGATVVEYHFEGFDEQFEGIDWKSLRLVFEQVTDGTWYLVAIVHDQWTV